ncbi:MAG: sigma-70 family RNA polymerase sigma factor [Chlorobi bacterium]|nr:sigma-70 family RNA polymerase sigma factor [Chlorobiota bacterium]
MGTSLTDERIIAGICSGDRKIIHWFYEQVFPVVNRFVKDHQGTGQDAHDLFQDALLILYKKKYQDDFTPQGSVKDYLLGVCRKLWYRKYRKHHPDDMLVWDDIEDPVAADAELAADEIAKEDEKYALYLRHFSRLEKTCREILALFFRGIGYEEMSRRVKGYSLHYLPRKKQKCFKKLVDGIRQDPSFKRLS